MEQKESNDALRAGTGFMLSSTEALKELEKRGYTENLVPKFDHFEARSGAIRLFAKDIIVDEMIRFENTSDPDDQSILYAVSSPTQNVKGVYIEAYGLDQNTLSPQLTERLKKHLH